MKCNSIGVLRLLQRCAIIKAMNLSKSDIIKAGIVKCRVSLKTPISRPGTFHGRALRAGKFLNFHNN